MLLLVFFYINYINVHVKKSNLTIATLFIIKTQVYYINKNYFNCSGKSLKHFSFIESIYLFKKKLFLKKYLENFRLNFFSFSKLLNKI